MSNARPHHAGRLIAMHCGDGAAARALWEEHAGRLIALARAITGSNADAHDAVQEAFVAVLALSPAAVAGVEDEGAYLAGAVRSRALNLLRGAERRGRREEVASEVGGAGEPRALRLVEEGEDEELRRAVDALPLEQREVVALKHFAGLSFEQMAAALGVARGTAASRYYSAVEALRASMSRTTGGGGGAGGKQEVARAL
ncbi:MAG: sigma-70 family RNA polymerase sigma factor [Phycisphaerales bacterium]